MFADVNVGMLISADCDALMEGRGRCWTMEKNGKKWWKEVEGGARWGEGVGGGGRWWEVVVDRKKTRRVGKLYE